MSVHTQDVLTIDVARWNATTEKLVVTGQSDTLNLVYLSDENTLDSITRTQAGDENC